MVDKLFIVSLIFCGSSVFGPYFVVRSLVSFLVVQSSLGERES